MVSRENIFDISAIIFPFTQLLVKRYYFIVKQSKIWYVVKSIEFQFEQIEKWVHVFRLSSESYNIRFATVLSLLDFEVTIVVDKNVVCVVNHAIRIKLLVCTNHLIATLPGWAGQYSTSLPYASRGKGLKVYVKKSITIL